MNSAYPHLLLNHVPVLGVLLGLVVLAAAMWRRHDLLGRLALTLFVASALAAIPTYLSGEPAEHVVERAVPGVEAWIEPHEDAATVSLALVELLGVLSLAALWMSRREPAVPGALVVLTLAVAVAAAGSLAWTADLGGQIRHSEIRGNAPPVLGELR